MKSPVIPIQQKLGAHQYAHMIKNNLRTGGFAAGLCCGYGANLNWYYNKVPCRSAVYIDTLFSSLYML